MARPPMTLVTLICGGPATEALMLACRAFEPAVVKLKTCEAFTRVAA